MRESLVPFTTYRKYKRYIGGGAKKELYQITSTTLWRSGSVKYARVHAAYISRDRVFAGGRFIVSMAMPDFSSTVLITKSLMAANGDVG